MKPGVNRLAEHGRAPFTHIDPERQAIQLRIETAKSRLVADLDRASKIVRNAASTARRSVGRVVLVGGLLLCGLAISYFVRRRKRLRVIWR